MIKDQFTALKSFLSTPKNIAIIGHKGPDGDAVGSTLALSMYLKKLNHNTSVIVPNDFPDFLKWMPQSDSILIYEKENEKVERILNNVDLIFTLDFNSLSRVGYEMQTILEKTDAPFAMIDHHQLPEAYATYNYSDVSICSTAQMVYHFIEMMNNLSLLDKDIASCIYTGIMTDTGSFRYSSTSATTHKVVAHLIEKGVDNAAIHQAVFDTNSPDRMQLLGVALQNLVILDEFNTAYITLSQEELDKHNFQKGDTEGFVNYGLSIKNIKFAVIFIEHKQENLIKISFRSIGDFNVNHFARMYFEGGGHNNAAGGKSNLSMKETVNQFITNLQSHKKELVNE
ncbi:MAG: bifunctional oligoribonuclease/PAP phosphatase NrnA [Flavobacteriaceae bacterium]|nr:bifunctional oligoribonuclease/PAP phosphatase NrnA [Flavobacteriaceae bacterium]